MESVHPSYGTIVDFERFLHEAHRRGLRVITELVITHTSNKHIWFRRARAAPPELNHRSTWVRAPLSDIRALLSR